VGRHNVRIGAHSVSFFVQNGRKVTFILRDRFFHLGQIGVQVVHLFNVAPAGDVVDKPFGNVGGRKSLAEPVATVILLGPGDEWGNLLAVANRQLGQAFLEKGGVGEGAETAHGLHAASA
jgi:hypothetical protein